MWKTLTAKSSWLPVAYRLFQGKRYTRLIFCVCVCLFVCEHVVRVWMQVCLHTSLCARESVRYGVCICVTAHMWICTHGLQILLLKSLQHLIRHTPQSNPAELWATISTYKSLPKQEHNFTPLRGLQTQTHFRSRRCTCNYRCRVKNNNYCWRSP